MSTSERTVFAIRSSLENGEVGASRKAMETGAFFVSAKTWKAGG